MIIKQNLYCSRTFSFRKIEKWKRKLYLNSAMINIVQYNKQNFQIKNVKLVLESTVICDYSMLNDKKGLQGEGEQEYNNYWIIRE